MFSLQLFFKKTVLAGLKLILFTQYFLTSASAADNQDKFAAVGAGVASCERYVEARELQSQEYFLFGGWIDGYFSARNQLDKETYTLVPWQSIDTLAGFVTDYCKKNPDVPFQRAVMVMAEALYPHRLQHRSARTQVVVGELRGDFFIDVIIRLQEKLKNKGLYQGNVAGDFTQQTATALREFQLANTINATGFPDQLTLFRLFSH